MGPARLSQPDLLPRGRQGRTLRGLGTAGTLRYGDPSCIQVTAASRWKSGGAIIAPSIWFLLEETDFRTHQPSSPPGPGHRGQEDCCRVGPRETSRSRTVPPAATIPRPPPPP